MRWQKVPVPNDKQWAEILRVFERRNGFSYTRKPRCLVDENLGEGAVDLLKTWDQNVKGVWEVGLVGHPDENVWAKAKNDRRIILTHDDDFLCNIRFPLRASHGVAVFPHKEGGEAALISKLAHFVAMLNGGAGFMYEQKIVISGAEEWRIIRLAESGAVEETLYAMADLNHVFQLERVPTRPSSTIRPLSRANVPPTHRLTHAAESAHFDRLPFDLDGGQNTVPSRAQTQLTAAGTIGKARTNRANR